MNILFLNLLGNAKVSERGIYQDLIRQFRDKGHSVYLITPWERKLNKKTALLVDSGVNILGIKSLNIQKTNFIEKGIANMLLPYQYEFAIKRYLRDIKFDLILYSTPPITLTNLIARLKKKYKAKTYLLLKQNAVDLKVFSNRSILYRHFRRTEKKLYEISDNIGCMSPANKEYLLKHNDYLNPNKVEINPNSVELQQKRSVDKEEIRKRYDLPINLPVLIYGGNLGKPQGVDYIIKVLQTNKDRKDCFFLIIGNGTEYHKLDEWISKNKPNNVKLMQRVPKSEYDILIASCDIGLIFLDHRFTIPNYPSRLLSYLEYKMPILAATDRNTDIGRIAEDNGYGVWCESNDVNAFTELVDKFVSQVDIKQMGEKGYDFLMKNYTVDRSYYQIFNRVG